MAADYQITNHHGLGYAGSTILLPFASNNVSYLHQLRDGKWHFPKLNKTRLWVISCLQLPISCCILCASSTTNITILCWIGYKNSMWMLSRRHCIARNQWIWSDALCDSVYMMMSSNGSIFCVTGYLCGEFTGLRWIPPKKCQWRGALMFFFHLHLNKRLSKQSWGWWFETPSRPLWRHRNVHEICNVTESTEIIPHPSR